MSNYSYYQVPSIHPLQVSSAELFRLFQQHYQNAGHRSATFIISWWWIFAIYIMIEIMFAGVMYSLVLPTMHEMRKPAPCHTDIVRMMKRNIDQIQLLDNYTFEMYIEGFFNQSKLKDVGKENFKSFLSWGMFHKHLKDLSAGELENISEIFDYTASLYPDIRKMKEGHNKAASHCRMTLEPVPIIHRPLLFYAILHLCEALSNFLLLNAGGFEQYEMDGITYWYKRIKSTGREKKDPMLFLHGIAPGWMVYMPIVRALGEGRTLILVDLDAIKIKSLNFNMPTPEQFVDCVMRILDRHCITKVSVAGHSFGSITAGWIVRKNPECVSHLTLIDPVSLLLGLPDVGYSFLYRQPTSWIEWIIYVGAAREITVSYALRRHFFWYNNILWLEDIPAHIGIVVGVSSHDEVTRAPAVYEYAMNCRQSRINASTAASCNHILTRSMDSPSLKQEHQFEKIECVMWDGFSHGQILIPSDTQKEFVELVHKNEKKAKSL